MVVSLDRLARWGGVFHIDDTGWFRRLRDIKYRIYA